MKLDQPLYYRLAGLIISTEFSFPFAEPIPPQMEPDVRIEFKSDIRKPKGLLGKTNTHLFDDGDFWFEARKGLSFRILRGAEIWIEAAADIEEVDINTFLNGTAMGLLFFQRNQLPLHCSAVEFEGRAIGFTGPSGAGKSTLGAAISKRGLPHLSDDVLVVDPSEQSLSTISMPKGLKLWDEAAESLALTKGERVSSNPDLLKSYISMPKAAANKRFTLDRIYFLYISDTDEISIHKMAGAEKLQHLEDMIYRFELTPYFRTKAQNFSLLSNLANKLDLFRFERPADLQAIDRGVDVLLDHFKDPSR